MDLKDDELMQTILKLHDLMGQNLLLQEEQKKTISTLNKKLEEQEETIKELGEMAVQSAIKDGFNYAIDEQIQTQMRELRQKGLSYRKIAKELCVSLGSAYKYGSEPTVQTPKKRSKKKAESLKESQSDAIEDAVQVPIERIINVQTPNERINILGKIEEMETGDNY